MVVVIIISVMIDFYFFTLYPKCHRKTMLQSSNKQQNV